MAPSLWPETREETDCEAALAEPGCSPWPVMTRLGRLLGHREEVASPRARGCFIGTAGLMSGTEQNSPHALPIAPFLTGSFLIVSVSTARA